MTCKIEGCLRLEEAGRSRCRTCRRDAKRCVAPKDGMRTLLIDIETSPHLVYTWGLFKQNIGLNQIVDVTQMLCFAAKWLGEPGTLYFSQHKDGRAGMVEAAWKLLDEADAIMHWNGASFDTPHLNREFLLAGLTPPSPYAQIDLLRTSRKQFRFASQKLQHVSTQLGLEGKVSHEGFDLWRKCLAGDAKAWKRMEKYNRQDVLLLEEVHAALLPWITTHPDVRLYAGTESSNETCGRCGSDSLAKNGYAYTKLSKFQRFVCRACGSHFRGSQRLAGVKVQSAA